MKMQVYGDSISGNCLKVKWTADHVGLAYDWIETSVLTRATRTDEFLALNPAGQVPLVILPSGKSLGGIQRHHPASGGRHAADSARHL